MKSAIAAAAIVLAFSVGGATAASLIGWMQIRNHSIGLIDITRTAQKALHGQRGARGLVGPAGPMGPQGPAGPAGAPGAAQPSTVAYARVTRSGAVMADFSRNIKQVNVVRTGAGEEPLLGLSISINNGSSPAGEPAARHLGATVNPPTAASQLRRPDLLCWAGSAWTALTCSSPRRSNSEERERAPGRGPFPRGVTSTA